VQKKRKKKRKARGKKRTNSKKKVGVNAKEENVIVKKMGKKLEDQKLEVSLSIGLSQADNTLQTPTEKKKRAIKNSRRGGQELSGGAEKRESRRGKHRIMLEKKIGRLPSRMRRQFQEKDRGKHNTRHNHFSKKKMRLV